MKYANARKYKKAVNHLLGYLSSVNGCSNLEEWQDEVEAIKESIDPKDYRKYDELVYKLEIIGLNYADAYDKFEQEIIEFDNELNNILKKRTYVQA